MSNFQKIQHIDGYKTRAEAAKFLEVSKQSIYFFEKTGKLKATVLAGHIYYADPDVMAFKSAYVPRQPVKKKRRLAEPSLVESKQGKLAAAVIKCLQEGKDLAQTAILTKAHPEFVRAMWREVHTSFQARENEKRLKVEEKLFLRLARERTQRAKLDRDVELARIKAGL